MNITSTTLIEGQIADKLAEKHGLSIYEVKDENRDRLVAKYVTEFDDETGVLYIVQGSKVLFQIVIGAGCGQNMGSYEIRAEGL